MAGRVDAVREQFSLFYRCEVGKVTGYVVKVTGATVHEAADATQAAFVLAWENWTCIRNPRAWVRTVATRELYRSMPDRRTLAGQALVGDSAVVEPGEAWREVVAALAELPLMQRQVLAMTADDFPDDVIAHELGTTAQAVRQNRSRGRRALKAVLSRRRCGDA
ncbi:RNA polymerase sigma factor [Lentzea sp.]|uniref:RNA polymerase sigma factor n=1 Tax=Lentzea sp. TaxID=56099 RepID=UPI002ED23CD1